MAEAGADTPIVDAHAHVFTMDMPLDPQAWTAPKADYTAEDFVAHLDAAGIRYGVIAGASLFGTYNRYTLDALERHDRLRATVIVEPDCTVDEMAAFAAVGVIGVRFQWRNLDALPDLEGPAFRAFLARLADAGLHVELLCMGAMMPVVLPRLQASGVKIVIDHLGVPDRHEGAGGPGFDAVVRAASSDGVWVKVAALHRIADDLVEACTLRLVREVGPEKMMWGSDAPFVGHEDEVLYAGALARFQALPLSVDERRRIGRTAADLWF